MDKEFLNDGMTNEELTNIIKDIIKKKKEISYSNDNEKFEILKKEFHKFADRYLMLF